MGSTLLFVEIQSWDWPLHVGVRPHTEGAGSGAEGNLMCVEAITINGIVLAPEEYRSKLIHIGLSPLPRELICAVGEERVVGWLYKDPVERQNLGFYATLFLPADTLHSVIFCLGLLWHRIHMWIDDGAQDIAVTDFGFSVDAQLRS